LEFESVVGSTEVGLATELLERECVCVCMCVSLFVCVCVCLWCPRLGSFGVVVLEIVSELKAMDFRQPEVLLVKKVHEFEVRKTPLEALVDMGLNGEYNLKELMRLVSLGAACTRSDPKLRPNTTQIVSILDGNDKLIMGENMDSMEDWRERNACFSY